MQHIYPGIKKRQSEIAFFTLLTQVQRFDDFTIPADILYFQIVKQPPSFSDQTYQRPLSTEILLVLLKVFSQVRNPVGEQSYLTLSTASVHI